MAFFMDGVVKGNKNISKSIFKYFFFPILKQHPIFVIRDVLVIYCSLIHVERSAFFSICGNNDRKLFEYILD